MHEYVMNGRVFSAAVKKMEQDSGYINEHVVT